MNCTHESRYADNVRAFPTKTFSVFRITAGDARVIFRSYTTVYFYSELLGQFGGKRDCYATAIKRSLGGEFPEGKIVLGGTEP